MNPTDDLDLQFGRLVCALKKRGDDIAADITPEDLDMWHMATGISGEAGELLDAVKKHVIYRKPIDIENVIEELGDLEFYMEGLRRSLDISHSQVLIANINKLTIRYGSQYSNQGAVERKDKQ